MKVLCFDSKERQETGSKTWPANRWTHLSEPSVSFHLFDSNLHWQFNRDALCTLYYRNLLNLSSAVSDIYTLSSCLCLESLFGRLMSHRDCLKSGRVKCLRRSAWCWFFVDVVAVERLFAMGSCLLSWYPWMPATSGDFALTVVTFRLRFACLVLDGPIGRYKLRHWNSWCRHRRAVHLIIENLDSGVSYLGLPRTVRLLRQCSEM